MTATSDAAAAVRRHAVFHDLRIAAIDRLTDDAVALTFDVPPDLADDYRFTAGQHVSIRCELAGDDVRRNYSICTPAGSGVLRVAVKRLPGGAFSTHALDQLHVGDRLDVMTPVGHFGPTVDPTRSRHYAAFAAGSGITPVLSILSTVLAEEPGSRATLVYGNRTTASIMFLDEVGDLKDRYPGRLVVMHVLSRESRDVDLFRGRIDGDKVARLLDTLLPPETVDDWFLCGPAEMIDSARDVLSARGVDPKRVHRELFHVGPAPARALPVESDESAGGATVTVILDGRETSFSLSAAGESILEAALRRRPDAPFACKGGVCGTCRARLVEGTVAMDQNYALEADELVSGVVLACQSHPTSERVTLDFDR